MEGFDHGEVSWFLLLLIVFYSALSYHFFWKEEAGVGSQRTSQDLWTAGHTLMHG